MSPEASASKARRGVAPGPDLDPAVVCAGAPREQQCETGIELIQESCRFEPDPDACLETAGAHACVWAPRSIECIAFLDEPCFAEGSLACILGEGLLSIYCGWAGRDPTLCLGGPICCSSEAVGPDGGPAPGTTILTSQPGGDPIGVPDPGASGDRGLEASSPPTRRRPLVPFTGFAPLALALGGIALLLGGIGIAPSGSRRRTAIAVGVVVAVVFLPARAGARPEPGALRFAESVASNDRGVRGLAGISGIAVSPDSRHVYVTAARDDAVTVLRRVRHGLAFVESDADGDIERGTAIDALDGASAVAVAADGRHVYVAAGADNAVSVFARNRRTGRLRLIESESDGANGVEGLAGASGVAVSPDGGSVYVTGFGDGALAAFARDRASGRLAFVEAEQPAELGGAFSVTVAPDSAAVHATGFTANNLVSFERQRPSGALNLASLNGQSTVLWPKGPVAVAASPYGRDVYAAMLRDSAVTRFRRGSGEALAFTGFVKNGIAGTSGIGATSGVAIAPDATGAYATGATSDALAFFSVRDTTGALDFKHRYRNRRNGVRGLNGPAGVAVAPDGRRVYAIANAGARDTVAVFARRVTPLLRPLRARGVQRARKLDFAVGCTRSCRLTAVAGGATGSVKFASGRFRGRLADDRRYRVRLEFDRRVLKALAGQKAEVRIAVSARDRLGTRARRTLRVEIIP